MVFTDVGSFADQLALGDKFVVVLERRKLEVEEIRLDKKVRLRSRSYSHRRIKNA